MQEEKKNNPQTTNDEIRLPALQSMTKLDTEPEMEVYAFNKSKVHPTQSKAYPLHQHQIETPQFKGVHRPLT